MSRTNVASVNSIYHPLYVYTNGEYYGDQSYVGRYSVLLRDSHVTPGFGERRRLNRQSRSLLPMLPFTYQMRNQQIAIYCDWRMESVNDPTQTFEIRGNGYYVAGAMALVPWQPSPDEILEMRDQNVSKILEKLKDQKVNLGQVYAERKMTADLVSDTAKQLAMCFSRLRKGDYRGAGAALGVAPSRFKTAKFNAEYKVDKWKAAANGWLSYQYGWQPLLQDVHGSAEWLASKQSREMRSVVRSRITRKMKSETAHDAVYADVVNRQIGRYDSNLTVWFATSGSELADLKEAGITNPALLAWELLPYSFVVDWFLPIGDYISSLDATLGLTFEKGCFTSFLDSSSISHGFAANRTCIYMYNPARSNLASMGSDKLVTCTRSPIYDFPRAALPRFKNPLSFSHATSAISLLIQTFKR